MLVAVVLHKHQLVAARVLRYYDYFSYKVLSQIYLSAVDTIHVRHTIHRSGMVLDVNNVSIMSEEFRRMRQFVEVLQVCRVTSRVVSSSVYVETMFGVTQSAA